MRKFDKAKKYPTEGIYKEEPLDSTCYARSTAIPCSALREVDVKDLTGLEAIGEGQVASILAYPEALTDDLKFVLGMMNYNAVPIAHAFRDAGLVDIPKKIEEEQAFVLHWLTVRLLRHGSEWRAEVSEELKPVLELAKKNIEARAEQKCQSSRLSPMGIAPTPVNNSS